MPTATSPAWQPTKVLLTVDQVIHMSEAGIFAPDQRFELIEGELVEMPAPGPRHMQAVNRLTRRLVFAYGETGVVSVQNGLALRPLSLPLPDLVVLRPEANEPGYPLPGAADSWLVIEVAETSLSWDRRVKFPMYAWAGVPVAWLVDVERELVEVHSQPGRQGYGQREVYAATRALPLPGLDQTLQVRDIFR